MYHFNFSCNVTTKSASETRRKVVRSADAMRAIFTAAAKGGYGVEHGRRSIVEMMWEIIYADGPVTDFESNLMWRAADLLGISPRERTELGQHVASRRRTEPERDAGDPGKNRCHVPRGCAGGEVISQSRKVEAVETPQIRAST